MFHIASAIIGGSILVAGLGCPITLFELSQPGHFVNKYYQELHPSALEEATLNAAATPQTAVTPKSAIAEAPTIVIPTAYIEGYLPQ